MKTTQLKEKVQEHVDSLFLTLSEEFDVQVSKDVQNRFTNWLSQEAVGVLQAQKKQGLVDATEKMFTELQNDLKMTFSEQTKSNLLELLLADTGISFEDNPTEIKPKDVSSDKPELHPEEKSEAEADVSFSEESLSSDAHAEAKHDDVVDGVKIGEGQKVPEATSQKVPEATSQKVPEATSQKVPEATSQKAPKVTSQKAPEATSQKAPKVTSQKAPKATSQKASEVTSQKAPKATSQKQQKKNQKTELKEDKQEVHEKLPQVAEPKAPQVADETVQEVDKVATRKNSGKPWTEECHDPQIINKVNEVIALYYKEEFGKKKYLRDMNVKHVFNPKLFKTVLFSDAIGVFFDILLSSSTYNLWETLGDVYDSVLYLLKEKRNKKQVAETVQKTELKEDKQEVHEKLPQVAEPKAPQVADETVQEVDKVATHRNSAKPWTEECHDPEIILAVNNIMSYFMGGVSGYYTGPVSRNTRLVSDLKCSKSEIVMICHDIEKFVGVDIEKSICDEWETFGDLYDCVLYFQKRKGEKKQISDLTEREIYQNSEKSQNSQNSQNSQISQPKANEVYKKPWSNCYVDPNDPSDEIRKIVDMVNQNLKDKLRIDKSEITRESRLKDDLGVDSLNIVEGFEKDFDTYIPREMAEHVQTIGDLYDCIYYSFKF